MPDAFANFGMRAMPPAKPAHHSMKKVLPTVLLLLSLSSCQKKYCWKCITQTIIESSPAGTVNTGFHRDTTSTNSSVCDKTAGQIKDYEKTDATIRQQGNVFVSTTTSTTCDK